ncbi:hypothetical protein IWW36_000363 [Coemansia brasiliensis]|uniref:HMG box domain-containing protein n=1 Tax=Coemansia brasiliensis TaxID=2650707 RepID=A0A9W8M2H9_9FUNG|nr:hypothetical protein IWW36_000363 [Coemansia brasiliensis]
MSMTNGRNKVDEETKKLKNREFLRLMSSRWKSMSEVERKPYVQLAEEDKRRFNEDEKKFGKYESRQRRYNKVRTSAKHHGTAPYSLPQPALPSHTQFPNMLAANPTLFYGNLANVTPGQAGVNAEALSHLYMNLQKQPGTPVNNTQTNPQLLVNSSATRQPQYQSQQSFLAPPPSLDQRNSAPSSTGSVADINDLQSTLRPSSNYNWSAAALGGAVSAAAAHAQYPNAAATALYQQPSSPGFMQLPTGAPISHSLTHPPALYDNGLNLPLNGGNSGSNWSLQQ